MMIGHVALAIPYVVLVVGTGLQTLPRRAGRGGHEPRLDARCTPSSASPCRCSLPSLVAAALFAFAVSLDQFVVSYFLATPGVTTLPVEIYSAIRKGFTPEINAISTILLARLDGACPRSSPGSPSMGGAGERR